jgi:C-terminal processing protease CtpA/Prc
LCSYLFDTKTHLNSLYRRQGDRTTEFWTLDEVDGKKRPNVPVFVLTSERTFSGGEGFAYNLQALKRATVVGEITGGGAHPGSDFDITSQLHIFVPTGKAINPVTKTNWEGVGVKPDVEVEAERALEKATALAKRAARKYRKSK